MSFQIGDSVAVLDDVIKGKVIKISGNIIVIETEDGFPMEFAPNELVNIKSNQSDLSKFSDLSMEDLMEKVDSKPKRKNVVGFKSDSNPDKTPAMEVDLHIHNLTKSVRGLDNYDMLNIQINEAKHKLEFAIRSRIPKVVFIHGVGAGVLKAELEFLFKNYQVRSYEASFKKYGLGATEVYIYQNTKG